MSEQTFSKPAETAPAPISTSNILWGAAATALLGATLAEWQRKREEEEARRAALRADGPSTYRQIAKAYQRAVSQFKEALLHGGFSQMDAAALKTQAVLNGFIPSAGALIQEKKEKEQEQAARLTRAEREENASILAEAAVIKDASLLSLSQSGTIGLIQRVNLPVTSLGYYDLGSGRYISPSGMPKPSGNNLEINVLAGISVKAKGYDNGPATVGLLYYSLGLVTDKQGGVQFYYTTKDQEYILGSSGHMGGYLSGSAEREYPTDAYGIGITVNRGVIFGKEFTTPAFLGKGYSSSLGVGPASIGRFEPFDKTVDFMGYEYGISPIGGPISMGTVATDTYNIGNPIQLSQELIPVCNMMGQCGVVISFP